MSEDHWVCARVRECLQVDQVEVRGAEVGAQRRVRVLQPPQDAAVELGADPVELHDVAGILLDPESVKRLHQVTWDTNAGQSQQSSGSRDSADDSQKVCWKCCRDAASGATLYR